MESATSAGRTFTRTRQYRDLMPRGAKRALADTRERHFINKRSFVSTDGHEYLYGKDKAKRYREFVESSSPYCANCGRISYDNGEMDHIQGGLVGRCDCLHNLQWLCKSCHRAKHVQVKWSKAS